MPQQKYIIKGEFTIDQIDSINESLKYLINSEGYDTKEIEMSSGDHKDYMVDFNNKINIAKDLLKNNSIKGIKLRKNTKQDLLNKLLKKNVFINKIRKIMDLIDNENEDEIIYHLKNREEVYIKYYSDYNIKERYEELEQKYEALLDQVDKNI